MSTNSYIKYKIFPIKYRFKISLSALVPVLKQIIHCIDQSIFTGATIDGIVVDVERKYKLKTIGSDAIDTDVKLLGLTGSSDKATYTPFPGSDQYQTYGGLSDLWGTSDATPTTINSATFGVEYRARFIDSYCVTYPCSVQAFIDHIKVTVGHRVVVYDSGMIYLPYVYTVSSSYSIQKFQGSGHHSVVEKFQYSHRAEQRRQDQYHRRH